MIDEAWEHSLRSVTAEMRSAVLMCKLLFLIERGEVEAAEAAGERLVAEGTSLSSPCLDVAHQLIVGREALTLPGSAAAQSLSKIANLVRMLNHHG
jgi:hypothetical protein